MPTNSKCIQRGNAYEWINRKERERASERERERERETDVSSTYN